MTKDRQIVLMLIPRKMLAKKLLDRYSYVSEENRLQLYAHHSEAHNAAESARCALANRGLAKQGILYGYEL